MNEHADVMDQVRESFSGLRMNVPVENVLARGRAYRRRRAAGLTAAAAGTAGAAAAIAMTLGGTVPVHSGNPPRLSVRSATLAAYSLATGPGDSTILILHRGPQYAPLDPTALRQALAAHGIPAQVTVGTFCRPANGKEAGFSQFVHPEILPDGSDAMVIDGSAMPPETQLSIGYFPSYIKMAVVEDGAALSCSSSTDPKAAVHFSPSGTPVG